MASQNSSNDQSLVKTLSSIQFGIVVLAAIIVVSLAGTLIPQSQPFGFYREHFGPIVNFLVRVFRFDITYRSPLFIGLLCLLGLNLTLCSVVKFPAIYRKTFHPDRSPEVGRIEKMQVHESVDGSSIEAVGNAFAAAGFSLRPSGKNRLFGQKGQIGFMGSTLVHISLLLFLAGGLVSLITGQRGYIMLEKGQSSSEVTLYDDTVIPLGFEIRLNEFTVEFYENFQARPKSYQSDVTVTMPGEQPYDTKIRVNHPIMRNGFTVYQSSYGNMDDIRSIAAENDTAIVVVKPAGADKDIPPLATIPMVMGETYTIPGFGDDITLSLSEMHLDFRQMQMASNMPNPAMKIDVNEDGELKWSVYAFKNFPGMNMPMSDDLKFLFELQDIRTGPRAANEYYTVLGVVKDKGVGIMWAAALVLIFGMLFSFYVRPKRIWVLDTGNNILIGGSAKGNPDTLKKIVKNAIKNI